MENTVASLLVVYLGKAGDVPNTTEEITLKKINVHIIYVDFWYKIG